MTNIALILDHRKRAFEVVTAPYYQSKNIVCATNLNGEDISTRPEDLYVLDDAESKEAFFTLIRDSFHDTIITVARSPYKSVTLTILNGVCVLHISAEEKYTVQFTIEKGIKLNENVRVSYEVITNSYIIRTVGSIRRNARYETRQPRGESYDRVLMCLTNIGPLTTPEIAKLLGLSENRISGRISEMRKCGLIHKNGIKTVDGRSQTVWAVSKKDRRIQEYIE